jgi:hypothetical protein
MAGAIALVVAGLAAVGVSGGLLARAVRNAPGLMTLVVSMAILIPASWLVRSNWTGGRRPVSVLLFVLALASVYAVSLGAASLVLQETPSVSASAERTDDGYTASVEAKAAGLRADGDMLVQIVALDDFPEDGSLPNVERACAFSRLTQKPDPNKPASGTLLAWQQAGPDSNGEAAVSFRVAVPADTYSGLCAAAVYQRKTVTAFDKVRTWLHLPQDPPAHVSVAVVRLA